MEQNIGSMDPTPTVAAAAHAVAATPFIETKDALILLVGLLITSAITWVITWQAGKPAVTIAQKSIEADKSRDQARFEHERQADREAALRAYRYERLKGVIDFVHHRQGFYLKLQSESRNLSQADFNKLLEQRTALEHPGIDAGVLSVMDDAVNQAVAKFELADEAIRKRLEAGHLDATGNPIPLGVELKAMRDAIRDVFRAVEEYIHRL